VIGWSTLGVDLPGSVFAVTANFVTEMKERKVKCCFSGGYLMVGVGRRRRLSKSPSSAYSAYQTGFTVIPFCFRVSWIITFLHNVFTCEAI